MREIKPTQKDAPSSDVKDLFFNSGLLDIWATSLEHKYIDRFGNCHLTAAGMEWLFKELVEKFKVDMNTAIVAAGYITIDSFQQGADLPNNELTQRNHILRDEATGEYYRWDGDLPKQVPAGSTPQSTGGIGKGAWVSVGDATLRSSLAKNDGFSNIGACNSIEELKNVTPENNLQRIIVNKYYASESYFMPRQYIWYSTSLRQDDGGVVIASNKISTGRWVLQEISESFDARVFGMKPEKEYSDTMMNCATQFVKAASVVTQNGSIHFVLPNGWESAHYLINDPYKIDFGKCWIKADKGVTLHIPGTADREGWQPRVKGDVTISEQAPDNQNTFITKRGCNDYDLKAAIASAMVTAGMSIDHAEFPIKLTESVRAIKVDNFTGNATALYSIFNSGLLLSDDAVSWSDANAAGAASAGIELAASEGSEVEVLVSNKGRATLGVVSVGVRSMTADGSIGSFITLRLAINSNEIKIVNGDTVTATYTMEQLPHDYLHASKQTSVRVGVRTHGNGKKTTFLINGKPLHTHTSYSTSTHSIVCLASQEARSGIHFQFLYSRVRDFINYAVPVSICCLGDSITKGARATNEWPRLIQNYAEHLPGVGKIERLDNFAISGWNSTEVLNDLVNHDFSKYTHVLIQVGTNDCQTANENDISGAMAAYANNITAISNHIKSKNAKCTVIFSMFPKWTNKDLSGGGQNTVNLLYTPNFQSTLRWIAQANARDVIFSDDFFGDNYGYKNSFTDMSPYWTNDNIHPNTRGHIALAAAFASGLSKSLSQPSRGAISQILQLKNNFTLHNEHENGLLKVHKVDNVVTISGAVTAGEVGAVITTLPAFARPATSFLSPCLTSIGVATVRVDSAGDISVLVGYAKGNSLDLNITYSI
ncbi:GDSL-type esterase/lipase family protein [Providencia huashanensis]|uniref:tail fiber/spike domain-containing protein n=1 Tax=Providencia huashanensis TaxID=3037798 RepID=UPI002AFE2AFE|nr:GDSL-type esterase/lipase family protein [Providencia sp. 3007]